MPVHGTCEALFDRLSGSMRGPTGANTPCLECDMAWLHVGLALSMKQAPSQSSGRHPRLGLGLGSLGGPGLHCGVWQPC